MGVFESTDSALALRSDAALGAGTLYDASDDACEVDARGGGVALALPNLRYPSILAATDAGCGVPLSLSPELERGTGAIGSRNTGYRPPEVDGPASLGSCCCRAKE